MDNKYQKGKIYKIVSGQTDKIYIGSTNESLKRRLQCHKSRYKTNNGACSVNEILKYDDVIILLIESYPCNTRRELEEREGFWIGTQRCVNCQLPGTWSDEFKRERKRIIKKEKKEIYMNSGEYKATESGRRKHHKSEFGKLCRMFRSQINL